MRRLLAVIALPLPAFPRRIHVEEDALTAAFGDAYRDYSDKTWGLVPGVW